MLACNFFHEFLANVSFLKDFLHHIDNTQKHSIIILIITKCITQTSNMGRLSEFHWSMRSVLRSTTVTVISGHFKAMTAHVGPPTQPAPMQQMCVMFLSPDILKSHQVHFKLDQNNLHFTIIANLQNNIIQLKFKIPFTGATEAACQAIV